MIGALIGAAGGLLSGAIGSAASKGAAGQANAFTERMMDKKHNWDRQAVLDNRAYNDPRQVMARLRAAGLNPDLMYGQGAGSLQNAAITAPSSSPQGIKADTSWTNNIVNPVMAGLDAKLRQAQIENVEEDTNKKKTDQANDSARVALEERGIEVKENMSQADILKINQEITNLEKDIDVMDANIDKLQAETGLTKEKIISEAFDRLMADKEYQRKVVHDNQEFIRWAHLNDLTDAQKGEILTLLPLKLQGMSIDNLKTSKEVVKIMQENRNLVWLEENLSIEHGMLRFNSEHQNSDRNWDKAAMAFGMFRDFGIGLGGIADGAKKGIFKKALGAFGGK